METKEKVKAKNRNRNRKNGVVLESAFVSAITENGNTVKMRCITDDEIKALRNPAYKYLA